MFRKYRSCARPRAWAPVCARFCSRVARRITAMSQLADEAAGQNVQSTEIDDILGASTGEFDLMTDDEGSVQADEDDLLDMLGESTGVFRVDVDNEGSPPRMASSKKDLVSAHLAYLSRRTSSSALDDVRARIRALTIEKQKLYRAMQR
mmetsp:Transcript_27424/g.64314  ORF Transcript_27424/g.64314 Transcript_27424/m.64314 type:complete len:149 (-) Transcript_27424:298-744(-)